MSYRIDYTPESVEDLNSIATYLLEEAKSVAAPLSVMNAIHRIIAILENHPHAGQVYAQNPRFRKLVEPKYAYLIFYEVLGEEGSVRIARILHSFRKIELAVESEKM